MPAERSTYRCARCGVPLLKDEGNGLCLLWCGHGPCPSTAANCGAQAPAEAEAAEKLRDAIEAEQEAQQ